MKARAVQFLLAAALVLGASGVVFAEEVVYVVNSYVHSPPPDPTWSTVAMVRSRTGAILKTVQIWGDDAHSVAVTPDGSRLWVTSPGWCNVTIIDAETFEQVRQLSLPAGFDPMGIAFTPDGSWAWVTFEGMGEIGIFDVYPGSYRTRIVIGGAPNFILFTPDGSRAYVVDYQNATVTVIRVSDREILDTLEFDGYALQDAVVSPDGSRVYVSNMSEGQIEVIRTSDNAILSPIVTAEIHPRGIGISPDGQYLFVGHYLAEDSIVKMIRLSDRAVVSIAPIASNPRCIAVRENGTRIYVTEHNYDKLYAYKVVGETLSLYKVTDLNTIPGYNASPVGVAIGERAHPQPDVKLNGSDGPIYLTRHDSVQLCLNMEANGLSDPADWWLIGDGPFGRFFWTPSTGWTPVWRPMYQGPLVDVSNFCSPRIKLDVFPPGRYTFYFAVDVQMDGLLQKPLSYYDKGVLFLSE